MFRKRVRERVSQIEPARGAGRATPQHRVCLGQPNDRRSAASRAYRALRLARTPSVARRLQRLVSRPGVASPLRTHQSQIYLPDATRVAGVGANEIVDLSQSLRQRQSAMEPRADKTEAMGIQRDHLGPLFEIVPSRSAKRTTHPVSHRAALWASRRRLTKRARHELYAATALETGVGYEVVGVRLLRWRRWRERTIADISPQLHASRLFRVGSAHRGSSLSG